jgi:hypothetical protein
VFIRVNPRSERDIKGAAQRRTARPVNPHGVPQTRNKAATMPQQSCEKCLERRAMRRAARVANRTYPDLAIR